MPKLRSDITDLRRHSRSSRIEEKYDWLPSVLDGKPYELVSGKDFTVQTETMRQSMKNWAEREGIPLVVKTEGENILVQLMKPKAKTVRRKGGSKR